MFVCSRSFYLLFNEKVFFIQCKVLYWNKILKVFIPIRICWIFLEFYYNCLVNTTLNMLTLPFNPRRETFKGEFFSLCCSYQAKTSQFIRSFCICEKFP